jgi:hypothetical protein
MTNNAELQQQEHESNEAHIERLQGIVRSRREEAQRELDGKRHLERTINAMSMTRAPASSTNGLHRLLAQTCTRLGVARGQVEIAEAHLVSALNR